MAYFMLSAPKRSPYPLQLLTITILTACGGESSYQYITLPNPASQEETGRFTVTVTDGPIKGALVYLETTPNPPLNSDIIISNQLLLGTTNANGEVMVSSQHAQSRLIADVSGAVDISTGAQLRGVYLSLEGDNGLDGEVLLSPLTDLVARNGGSQALLDSIFGVNPEGASIVSLADILVAENYDPTSQELVPMLISRASIALSEINNGDGSSSGEASVASGSSGAEESVFDRLRDLITLQSDDPLTQAISERLQSASDIANGKPLAARPYYEVISTTASTIALSDYVSDLISAEDFFGFEDPYNNQGEIESQLYGVFFKPIPIGNEDLSVWDTATIAIEIDGGLTPITKLADEFLRSEADQNNPLIAGNTQDNFHYVSLALLSDLVFINHAFTEVLASFEYYLWDGEEASDSSILTLALGSGEGDGIADDIAESTPDIL